MYVPWFSPPRKSLEKRRGGGGKGAKAGSSGSEGASGSVGSRGSEVPVSGSTVGRTNAVSYGTGTTKVITIPQGQLFAGRTSGGATRNSIYGNTQYGSGYPGVNSLGVAGRNFPFVYWPFIWGGGFGYGAAYLHTAHNEYGEPNNSSRPGGPLAQAAFSSSTQATTFHVVSDNSTVAALIASISANCTFASNSSTAPTPFNANANDPLPEQTVQYFRASSVALTLDGYNNTAALSGDANATAVPLPSNIDTTLLTCLNDTIGEAVPLFSAGEMRLQMPSVGVFVLLLVLWHSVF